MDLNREFRFRIFGCAQFVEIEREVARLWTMCQPYRAVYIHEASATHRVLDQHPQIIKALADGDHRAAIRGANRHRNRTERQIDTWLVRLATSEPVSAVAL